MLCPLVLFDFISSLLNTNNSEFCFPTSSFSTIRQVATAVTHKPLFCTTPRKHLFCPSIGPVASDCQNPFFFCSFHSPCAGRGVAAQFTPPVFFERDAAFGGGCQLYPPPKIHHLFPNDVHPSKGGGASWVQTPLGSLYKGPVPPQLPPPLGKGGGYPTPPHHPPRDRHPMLSRRQGLRCPRHTTPYTSCSTLGRRGGLGRPFC